MDLVGENDLLQVNVLLAKALIAGRIDCKTAGRLLVQLQTVSKLLRMMKSKPLPQIDADDTGSARSLRISPLFSGNKFKRAGSATSRAVLQFRQLQLSRAGVIQW